MVVTVCAVYSAGFITLVAFFFSASSDCAMASESGSCISVESDQTPDGCQRVVDYAGTIVYYEGVCSAVVAIVFTFYAFLFNGLIYATVRPQLFSCLKTRLTLHTRFLPATWQPSPYTTSGEAEQWRSSLRALGIKLSVVSVFSFASKATLVFLRMFSVVQDGSSLYLSMSTLIVEAFPSLLTITLLAQYHRGSLAAASGISFGDMGSSLLLT
jgi:hypothetical protein